MAHNTKVVFASAVIAAHFSGAVVGTQLKKPEEQKSSVSYEQWGISNSTFRPSAPLSGRCNPLYLVGYYSDKGCTQRINTHELSRDGSRVLIQGVQSHASGYNQTSLSGYLEDDLTNMGAIANGLTSIRLNECGPESDDLFWYSFPQKESVQCVKVLTNDFTSSQGPHPGQQMVLKGRNRECVPDWTILDPKNLMREDVKNAHEASCAILDVDGQCSLNRNCKVSFSAWKEVQTLDFSPNYKGLEAEPVPTGDHAPQQLVPAP